MTIGIMFYGIGFIVCGKAVKSVQEFHCIANSLSGIYIINNNIVGNIVTTIILIFSSFILNKVNNKKKIFI